MSGKRGATVNLSVSLSRKLTNRLKRSDKPVFCKVTTCGNLLSQYNQTGACFCHQKLAGLTLSGRIVGVYSQARRMGGAC